MSADGQRHAVADLTRFATDLFIAAGLETDKAATVGEFLVLTDRMGRRTHGLAMAPLYLAELAKGTMTKTGQPEVVKDTGASMVWDGGYLPGLWLVSRAIDAAMPRASRFGVACVAIRRSHHIGCLAALVKQAADKGYVALIANSDPAGARVAPFGGTEALYTPNPIAMGYPGREHPVLVDICASITTTSMTREKYAAGELFDQPWLIDAEGRPTRDPAVLEHASPRGALLPVGGLDHGHKGFGLSIMIEALSQGLSDHGRADAPERWAAMFSFRCSMPICSRGAMFSRPRRSIFRPGCGPTAPPIRRARCACREIMWPARSLSQIMPAWPTMCARPKPCPAGRRGWGALTCLRHRGDRHTKKSQFAGF